MKILFLIATFVPTEEIVNRIRKEFGVRISGNLINYYRNGNEDYKVQINKMRERWGNEIMHVELSHKRRRIEEIEKAMGGSGSAGLGDTSGVSQDQLGVLLTAMEDNDWTGLIMVGPAGAGKSLISKGMGNTYKVPSMNLDLGANKGSFVGQSEGKIRKTVGILKSFAGRGAFFIATSNGLASIPPELKRRFRYGTWYCDLPTAEERKSIWRINLKRFGLDARQDKPDDADFTGSDIRNVCDLAYRLKCPLTEAVEFIVPVAKSDPAAIVRLRESAHGKYLSATTPGAYIKPEVKQGRAVVL